MHPDIYPSWEQQADEEKARQYARAFYAETKRLEAEEEKRKRIENADHRAFCDFMQQFQPKMPAPDYVDLMQAQLQEVALNRALSLDNQICEIPKREVLRDAGRKLGI